MKIKLIPFLIVLGISALIGYAFFAGNSGETYNWLQFLVSGLSFLIILEGGLGFKYAEQGGVNIVLASLIFGIVDVVVNLIFTFAPFKVAPYIIISGILVLLDIGTVYGLSKALK